MMMMRGVYSGRHHHQKNGGFLGFSGASDVRFSNADDYGTINKKGQKRGL